MTIPTADIENARIEFASVLNKARKEFEEKTGIQVTDVHLSRDAIYRRAAGETPMAHVANISSVVMKGIWQSASGVSNYESTIEFSH